jgi:hypothetical protein
MRISEAISESTPLAVSFAGGAVLNIEYRPAATTLAQMEDMINLVEEAEADTTDESSKTPDAAAIMKARIEGIKTRLIDTVKEMVVSWDLTEEDGETVISLTDDGLRNVPMNVFVEITKSVQRHQSAGAAGKV